MTKISKNLLLETATSSFASLGVENFSIRTLAKKLGISPSVIYHYVSGEDQLLLEMYLYTNRQLGQLRNALPQPTSASKMFEERVGFQLDNAEKIVAVLKYYMAYRDTFSKNKHGFVPDKASLHIEEVLSYGKKTKEFNVTNIKEEAKVITHAINGFLLEYYPHKPIGNERSALIKRITRFILRALKGGEK